MRSCVYIFSLLASAKLPFCCDSYSLASAMPFALTTRDTLTSPLGFYAMALRNYPWHKPYALAAPLSASTRYISTKCQTMIQLFSRGFHFTSLLHRLFRFDSDPAVVPC